MHLQTANFTDRLRISLQHESQQNLRSFVLFEAKNLNHELRQKNEDVTSNHVSLFRLGQSSSKD